MFFYLLMKELVANENVFVIGSTYRIVPRTDFKKLSNLERPILLVL